MKALFSPTVRQFCLVLALIPALCFAADIYVSPTGDDSNDGLTPATAKASVRAALQAAGPGDTVYVAAGTYTGSGNLNQQLSWAEFPDRNLVGAGPDATIFQVDTPPFVDRLEVATMSPLFADFKVEVTAMANFDQGAFRFGDGGNNMNVTISNVWMQGPYDGNQVAEPIVAGTDGRRNGSAIWMSAFGTVNYYSGTLRLIHCCISEFGRVLAFNDYNADGGANTTIFQNCTLVNNADTGGGWVDAATIWLRGAGQNRWLLFKDSIFSHSSTDPNVSDGTWGARGISIADVNNICILDNNIMYTNSIAHGRCYFESLDSYVGLENEDMTLQPTYVNAYGVGYVYDRVTPDDFRGWKSIPEPGLFGGIILGLLFVLRRI